MNSKERRTEERQRVDEPIRIVLKDAPLEMEGKIVNISPTGLGMSVSASFLLPGREGFAFASKYAYRFTIMHQTEEEGSVFVGAKITSKYKRHLTKLVRKKSHFKNWKQRRKHDRF